MAQPSPPDTLLSYCLPRHPQSAAQGPDHEACTATGAARADRDQGLDWQRRNAPHSTHGLHTFSLRRKAGCLQERCCRLAERAQARCSRGGYCPWGLSEQCTSVEAGRVLPFSTSARRKIEAKRPSLDRTSCHGRGPESCCRAFPWQRGASRTRLVPATSAGVGLSKVQSVDQRMRLECGVGFRQLRTCRRTRPGQLGAARVRHQTAVRG